MIETPEGNKTFSFTEFKSNLEKILAELGHPFTYKEGSLALSSLIRAYADIRWLGTFTKMHNAYDWGYQQAFPHLKDIEEMKKRYAVIYIPYNYDVGPGDFVPQDIPYTHLVVDFSDGDAVITTVYHRMMNYYMDSMKREAAQAQSQKEGGEGNQ